MKNTVKWLQEEETDTLVLQDKKKSLVLYNDDINTFDFVIESLIKVCGHDLIQAEQCTYLVHYKGKCAVKTGSYTELKPLREALTDRGLSANIEH